MTTKTIVHVFEMKDGCILALDTRKFTSIQAYRKAISVSKEEYNCSDVKYLGTMEV